MDPEKVNECILVHADDEISSSDGNISSPSKNVATSDFKNIDLLSVGSKIFQSSMYRTDDIITIDNDIIIPSNEETKVDASKKQKPRKSNKVVFETIKFLSLKDVVYDKDEGTVTHIGIHKIDLCTNDCLKNFISVHLQKDTHAPPKSNLSKDALIRVITQYKTSSHLLKALDANEAERNTTTQKFSKRPSLLNIPNTFYRVVNIITSDAGKDLFN